MTNNSKFMSASLAGLLAIATAMAPVVLAAGPVVPTLAPRIAMQTKTTPDSFGSARLIVQYQKGTSASTSGSRKAATVQAAAARATLRMPVGTGMYTTALTASHVRGLGDGRSVIRLGRRLNETEMSNLLLQLRADPSVRSVQVDRLLKPAAWVDDEYFYQQWNFSGSTPGGINAETAWDTSTGVGVVVAVLDTGVVPHPDLDANMLPGYDFITDAFVSRRPTDERVPGAFDYGDYAEGNYTETDDCGPYYGPSNSSWHGMHVGGTVAEVTNNAIGVAGVAHNAKVLPVRVLGRCGGYTSDIADAVTWASGGAVAGVPINDNPAEVINMSLGGSGTCDPVMQSAIDGAVARGTIVVVAAGNSGEETAYFSPASCANVINVGASTYQGGKAYYSNHGPLVDIAAPGGSGSQTEIPNGFVLQAGNSSATAPDLDPVTGPAYYYNAGTSMSAPHVAATAALIQSVVATPLTPAEMEALLKKTARPFPVAMSPTTPIGVGILNAAKAVAKALEPPCDPLVQQCVDAIQLFNRVNAAGLSGVTGSETIYSFDAAAGSTLTFLTFGGLGDLSMYVSFDVIPNATTFQHRSARSGNSETIRLTLPQTGTYYINIVGVRSYSGVTISARQ